MVFETIVCTDATLNQGEVAIVANKRLQRAPLRALRTYWICLFFQASTRLS
jgi:hypothetical protein